MEQDMKTSELVKKWIAIATVMIGVSAYTLLIAVQAGVRWAALRRRRTVGDGPKKRLRRKKRLARLQSMPTGA